VAELEKSNRVSTDLYWLANLFHYLTGLNYQWASSLLGFVALAMTPFRKFGSFHAMHEELRR
jgi:hypothetical protein